MLLERLFLFLQQLNVQIVTNPYKNLIQERPTFHSSFYRMSHAALHQLGDAVRYFMVSGCAWR